MTEIEGSPFNLSLRFDSYQPLRPSLLLGTRIFWGGGILKRDFFAEGENFEDYVRNSLISFIKIMFWSVKNPKFSACGGLEPLKQLIIGI